MCDLIMLNGWLNGRVFVFALVTARVFCNIISEKMIFLA